MRHVRQMFWAVFAVAACLVIPESPTRADDAGREEQAFKVGVEAYVYGYPLVLMDVSKRVMTNVPSPQDKAAPVNQFAHVASFPDPSFKNVVSPNADTLYSIAWLDLAKEPIVLHVPDTQGPLLPDADARRLDQRLRLPGKRTSGTGEGDFALVGPGWNGTLPEGVKEIKSPTNMVWIIGRTQTNGKADYEAVHAIQKQYTLTPLSRSGSRTHHRQKCPSMRNWT